MEPRDELTERLARIERTLSRIERQMATPAAAAIDRAPHVVAVLTDVVDELVMEAATRGIDVDRALRGGLRAAHLVAELLQSAELHHLLDTRILAPESLATVAEICDALVESSREPAGQAGLWALVRATHDPDVQRALDFSIRFFRRLGRLVPGQDSDLTRE